MFCLILLIVVLNVNRLQTGMRGAFGKPQGTVARVHIGQPIMSVRSADRYKAQVIEALRRAKFKFPGRQKVIQLKSHFFQFEKFHIVNVTHNTFCLFTFRFVHRFSSQRNGDSPNSIVNVMKNSVTKDVWLQMVATLNTDQNTVQWLHGKRFKLKSTLTKFLFNQRHTCWTS